MDPVVETVRARLEKDTGKPITAGQVLGLWLKTQGVVEITLVGPSSQLNAMLTARCRTSSKEERVKEYLATQYLPDLTPEEVKAISEAGSKVHHRVFVSSRRALSVSSLAECIYSS